MFLSRIDVIQVNLEVVILRFATDDPLRLVILVRNSPWAVPF